MFIFQHTDLILQALSAEFVISCNLSYNLLTVQFIWGKTNELPDVVKLCMDCNSGL